MNKLQKLATIEGKTMLDMIRDAAVDSVAPGICTAEGCDYTTEVEPDQDAGHCEACGGKTVKSVLILAGLI